jgi:hypothetical protein
MSSPSNPFKIQKSQIRRQNATEVRLVEDDYVVKTLAADRANDPLDVWIIKSSQLHLLRSVERKPSRSLMSSIPYGQNKYRILGTSDVSDRWIAIAILYEESANRV